jgi:hypothetical protein
VERDGAGEEEVVVSLSPYVACWGDGGSRCGTDVAPCQQTMVSEECSQGI